MDVSIIRDHDYNARYYASRKISIFCCANKSIPDYDICVVHRIRLSNVWWLATISSIRVRSSFYVCPNFMANHSAFLCKRMAMDAIASKWYWHNIQTSTDSYDDRYRRSVSANTNTIHLSYLIFAYRRTSIPAFLGNLFLG